MTATRPTLAALVTAIGLALGGCGEEEAVDSESVGYEDAIEAREQNTVEIDGLRYRVVMFRQLNPRLASDGALFDGPIPEDAGVFAAFLTVCNTADERKAPTEEVTLQDAFGESFPRMQAASDSDFDYDARPLRPDICLPPEDGASDRAFPGAALLYAVPFDELSNRPFVLELTGDEDGRTVTRRIELDL